VSVGQRGELCKTTEPFLPHVARLHASVVYAVAEYPFVCLSVRQKRCCIETIGRIALVLGVEASFHLSRTVPSPKIRVLPSGTCAQTPHLENFATASPSCCQQNLSSSSSTVEFVDDTYTPIDESWLINTSRSTVTL